MSIQNIRTAVKNLKSTGELTVTRYTKFSVFSIENYDKYQTANIEPNTCLTENQQASNSQLTTIEEGKKERKERKEREGQFAPPTLENVSGYCQENGLVVDAEHFFDYYSSRGWMVGKTKIRDWKGKLRDWDRQDRKKAEEAKKPKVRPTGFSNFEQREYDFDKLEKALLPKSLLEAETKEEKCGQL